VKLNTLDQIMLL